MISWRSCPLSRLPISGVRCWKVTDRQAATAYKSIHGFTGVTSVKIGDWG